MSSTPSVEAGGHRRHALGQVMRLLARRPAFVVGALILLAWFFCALFATGITPYDPFDDYDQGHQAPGGTHLMGTDRLGRDVLSRVLLGSRDIMIVAPVSALLCVACGTILGLVMGYFKGPVDEILGRVVDALLALPSILLALLALVLFGSSKLVIIAVVGLIYTPGVARTVRSAVMTERSRDYITAARLRGESWLFIPTREILPNITGTVLVELTVRFGYVIFTVATLSFLGVGLQPPSADWALGISQEYSSMVSGVWWPTLFPSLAIASLVIAVNLVSDSLQRVLKS